MSEKRERSMGDLPAMPSYGVYLAAMFSHTLTMMARRRRIVLAVLATFAPVAVPLLLAFLSSSRFAPDGNETFVRLTEHLYLQAMAPLLALFFGSMLIGEDVELQTIPYLLTRPMPRSAVVLGRFGAYVVVTSAVLLVAMALVYAACTSLGGFEFTRASALLLVHYHAVGLAAVVAYGAVALCLGALTKRPIIYGVIFMFGWQRIVLLVPGVVDFLTIEKYLQELLPKLATERESEVVRTVLGEFQKEQILVGAPKALLALAVTVIVLLAATCYIVRHREYSRARAVGA